MSSRRSTRGLALSSAASLVAAAGLLVVAPAAAADFAVSTEAELVDAIDAANATPEHDTITLSGTGFALTGRLPAITEPVSIVGPGSDVFVLNADGWPGFEFIDAGDSSISGVHIAGADAVAGARGAGVHGSNTSLNVEDVDVTGSRYGAYIQGSDVVVTVADTVFHQSSDDGLYIDVAGTSAVTVSSVSASENGDDGVSVDASGSSAVTVTGLTANDNGDDGVYVNTYHSAAVTVTGLTANNNGWDGIIVFAYDSAVIHVANVAATGNVDDGVDLNSDDTSSVTARNLRVDSSGGNGLEIYSTGVGSEVIVTGAVAENSEDNGAYVHIEDGSRVEIHASTFSASSYAGISLYPAGDGDPEAASVVITDTTSDGNGTGSDPRGGLEVVSGGIDVRVENSTFSNNVASFGGGVFAEGLGVEFVLVNSTVSGNTASFTGGAWFELGEDSVVRVLNSTITDNHTTFDGSAGLHVLEGNSEVRNTILAGNHGSAEFGDFYVDSRFDHAVDFSLIQSAHADAQPLIAAGTGNLAGVSAQLGPLADNGGPTLTHLPGASSPAVNAGDPAFAGLTLDQRGATRVVDVLDMGSVEVQVAVLPSMGAESVPTLAGGVLLLALGGMLLALRRRAATV